jgi:hypothetical protein
LNSIQHSFAKVLVQQNDDDDGGGGYNNNNGNRAIRKEA